MMTRALLTLAAAALLASCSIVASPFTGSHETITLSATDPEAVIFLDGEEQGPGPVEVRLSRYGTFLVEARCPDGRDGNAWITPTLTTTGVIDSVSAYFIGFPLFGLLAPGAWTLDPDEVTVKVKERELAPGVE